MPIPPPVIKIVLLVSFIIKYAAPIKDARLPSTSDSRNSRVVPTRRRFPSRLRQAERRSRAARPGRDWRCTVVRVSQSPDPVFKPLCLHHHHLAVIRAMRHGSHPLKGGEEMHCKFTRVLIVAGGPELLLKPADGLSEEPRGLLRQSTALLVQLGAQAAKLTSSARKLLPVRVDATPAS